ncbi:MAG: hypothetical protein KJ060_20835 [Candidatus Hydrogenedentes bacterium]|nr:hypothetical protein [Candidatus Hydrogenedentota bacterium]
MLTIGAVTVFPIFFDRVADGLLTHLAGAGATPAQDFVTLLSNREIEVFELLGRGATVREIAERLCRSVKTIETHRERIMVKLGLDSSAKLVRQAVEWVTEEDRNQEQLVT